LDSVNANGAKSQLTHNATVMTMTQWKDAGSPIGDYWVLDKTQYDAGPCWFYWAAPLKPGNATGLLLNQVTMNKQWFDQYTAEMGLDKGYYYGINVVAQLATKDGTTDANGLTDNYMRFGDASQGGWSYDGQNLMETVVASDTSDTPTTPSEPTTTGNNLVVSGGSFTIDNIIFAEPGVTVTFTGQTTSDFGVQGLSVNGAKANAPVDTDYYTITVTNSLTNTLVFKTAAQNLYQLRITAEMPGEEIAYTGPGGAAQYTNGYRYDDTKLAVAIPSGCINVTKDSNGQILLYYGKGSTGADMYMTFHINTEN